MSSWNSSAWPRWKTARDCRSQRPRMLGKGHTNPRDAANPGGTPGTQGTFAKRQGATERFRNTRDAENVYQTPGCHWTFRERQGATENKQPPGSH